MPLYQYESITPEGEQKSGTIEAPSRMLANLKLREQGLRVRTLVEARTAPSTEASRTQKVQYSPWYPLRPVGPGPLADFYAQLSQLLRAGVTIHDAAHALQGRVHPRLRKVLREVTPALAEGESLTENLAKCPQIFPAHVLAMVQVGETSGNLDEICEVIASQYDEELRLQRMLLLPKVYYGIVLLFCILIPTFPWMISRGFSWYLHQLLTVLIPVIMGLIVLLLLGKVVLAVPAIKTVTDDLIYRLPFLAPFGLRAARARLLTSLHVLMRAGVDLPTAINSAAPTVGVRPMQAQLQIAAERIRAQEEVPKALQDCSALSDQAKAALSTAQQSGLYEQALHRLAERAVDERGVVI